MTAGDTGELDLISRIAGIVGRSREGVVHGIGDDAAVIDVPGPDYLLASVDMQVERTHFLPDAPPETLGRKSLAVNISDIAAMGGSPSVALVSLALRPDTTEDWVTRLYAGIGAQADRFGIQVAGGNLTRTDGPICIDITILGNVARDRLVLRTGSRVGDILGVTGALGGEAARRATAGNSDVALRVPEPRVAAGQALAASGAVNAMIDISDGLASEVTHLAESGGVGALLRAEWIPISETARRAGKALSRDPLSFALYGGDDYELLFAAADGSWQVLTEAVKDVRLFRVGTVLPREDGILLERPDRQRERLRPGGWVHF